MSIIHIAVALVFGGYGVYQLYEGQYIGAIHFLLIALYFYVTMFELSGRPFHRNVYLLLMLLLTADGIFNMVFVSGAFLSGFFSLFFALFSWQTYRKLSRE